MSAPPKAKKLPSPPTPEAIAALEAITPNDRFAAKGMGGWSPMPNVIQAHHDKFSGHVQLMLVLEIIRWTFGHERGVHEWAPINFSDLARRGNYTKKAFQLALDEAFTRMEAEAPEGTPPEQIARLIHRKKDGRHWLCKIVPEEWVSVKKYERNPNPGGTPTARDEAGRYTLSKTPVPMSEVFKGVPVEPAAAQFVEDAKTSHPVTVQLAASVDGVVSVIVRDAAPVVPESSILHKESVKHRLNYTSIHRLFAPFRAFLDPIFLKLFKKVPDEPLLTQIIELCDGAPPEMLSVRVNEKVRKGAYKQSGLVLELARDVGEAWRAEAEVRAAAEATEAAQQQEADRRQERLMAALCPECKGHGCKECDERGVRRGVCAYCFGDGCDQCEGTGKSDK